MMRRSAQQAESLGGEQASPLAESLAFDSRAEHDALDRVWRSPSGLFGWFMQVNQARIGKRFIVTAFIVFLLAGVLGLLMRLQLSSPQNSFLAAETYNQFFTVHGTAMMFLFAIPVMEGFAIYLAPLMIGTRDMAFPRLNAFGYYVYLIGATIFFLSLFLGIAPAAGWFNYVPLANAEYSPGYGVGIWTTMITFVEVSALTAAVELIATILKLRAPGMSLDRMPLFVWAVLVMSVMIVFAMPSVIVSSSLLLLDRLVGTNFFDPEFGGDPLLWQHLFWFFGHPEVYIILIPALGMVSSIIVTFTQKPIFGYTAIVVSMAAIGFVSFGLWVHHMFAAGLPQLGLSFFMVASAMIAIPSGVQVFCWMASLWGAKIRFATPMLFVLGFFAIFIAGGVTGVMVASIPFDLQVHDTYFIVAHLHYVLIGGAVFPLFGGVYYWYPKLTGRMLSEVLGRWSFGLMFVGFNLTFFPMHQLGLEGMPRRIYTYAPGQGWTDLNQIATAGAFVLALGILVSFVNALYCLRRGLEAGDDPWSADSLEWATASPPASYNHRHILIVDDRYPLWAWRDSTSRPAVSGLRTDRREVVVTSAFDATPHLVAVLPGPTPWPFVSAVAASVGFVGLLFHPIWFVVGFMLICCTLIAWFWPRRPWRKD